MDIRNVIAGDNSALMPEETDAYGPEFTEYVNFMIGYFSL